VARGTTAVRGSGIESILAADCGSVMTSVALLDRADDAFRLVARGEVPSSFEMPWSDVTLGVRQAIHQVEEITGRRLLDGQTNLITPQQMSGEGVDAFVLASSAGAPLRLLLVGLLKDLSLSSAHYIAAGTYAVIEDVLPLRDDKGSSNETQLLTLLNSRPEVVLIVGGADKRAREPILAATRVLALACAAEEGASKPQVLFAGHPELRSKAAEILSTTLEMRAVDDIRPAPDTEDGAAALMELENLYRERKMGRVPGFGALSAWSPVPAVPAAKAFGYVIRYLAEFHDRNVIGVDVGSMAVTVASVLDKKFSLVTRSDLGVGYSVGGVLKQTSVQNILRWVPSESELELDQARNILLNKELHPATVPQTRDELLLEQALAKEAMRLAWQDVQERWAMLGLSPTASAQRERDLIVGAGSLLARAPLPGQAALMLLDVVQPTVLSDLVIDVANLTVPLGAVATVQPLAAAQVIQQDAFLNLGTVVVPVGTAEEGEPALNIGITYQDNRTLEIEVPFGSLEVIPLPAGEGARLELRPTRRFDVGQGPGKAAETDVTGGVAGVMIDARGRPLPLPDDLDACRAKVQVWAWDIGA
jgi:hypothetical protein